MLSRIWKIVRVMFMCTIPSNELPKLSDEDSEEFSFLSGIVEEGLGTTNLGNDATFFKLPPFVTFYYFWIYVAPIWGM